MTRSDRLRLARQEFSVADAAVLLFVAVVVYWGYLTLGGAG